MSVVHDDAESELLIAVCCLEQSGEARHHLSEMTANERDHLSTKAEILGLQALSLLHLL